MITAATRSRLTTLVGLCVAALGTFVNDPDVQMQLIAILPAKLAPLLQIVGLLLTALGPSLKHGATQTTPTTEVAKQ